jgi:hypothetical protein
VALRAGRDFARGRHLVRVRQREAGGAVVELTGRPGGDGVATRASGSGRGEICRHVVRNAAAQSLCAVPGGLVATHAIGRVQRVVIADVAGSAGRRRWRHVRAREREAGHAVVKRSGIPARRGMTFGTICGCETRAGGRVYRVVRLLPGCEMALRVSAVRWLRRQIVVSVDVAQSALHVGVSLCQREASRAVVEVTSRPGGDGVAGRASRGRRGESCSNVVRHVAAERLRAVPGGLVATHAVVRAQRVVIVDVAGSAGRRIR